MDLTNVAYMLIGVGLAMIIATFFYAERYRMGCLWALAMNFLIWLAAGYAAYKMLT